MIPILPPTDLYHCHGFYLVQLNGKPSLDIYTLPVSLYKSRVGEVRSIQGTELKHTLTLYHGPLRIEIIEQLFPKS